MDPTSNLNSQCAGCTTTTAASGLSVNALNTMYVNPYSSCPYCQPRYCPCCGRQLPSQWISPTPYYGPNYTYTYCANGTTLNGAAALGVNTPNINTANLTPTNKIG